MYPLVITDPESCRIHEGHTATVPEGRREVRHQKRLLFLTARSAYNSPMWKLGAPIDAGMFEIKVLKRPIVALMESNQEVITSLGCSCLGRPRVSSGGGSNCVDTHFHKQEKSRLFPEKCYDIHRRTLLVEEMKSYHFIIPKGFSLYKNSSIIYQTHVIIAYRIKTIKCSIHPSQGYLW